MQGKTEAELASGHTGNSTPIQAGQYNKLKKSQTRIEVLDVLVPAHQWVAMIPDNDVADPH